MIEGWKGGRYLGQPFGKVPSPTVQVNFFYPRSMVYWDSNRGPPDSKSSTFPTVHTSVTHIIF